MGKRLTAVFLTVMLAMSTLYGCSHASDISSGAGDKDYPVAIGNVTIKQEPAGVAVLSPSIASVILSMGYEAVLKARSEECTQSDLSVLPVVTADDAEKIHELGAEIVFADSLTDSQKSKLEKAGITVLTLAPATSRENLEDLYFQVGSALKGARTGYQQGQDAAKGIYQTIDDITRVVPASDAPITAVYLYDANGKAATGDMLAAKLLEAAGLTNSAAGGTDGTFKAADLLVADPKYIFCAKGVSAALTSSAEYSKLTAVKEKRVYEMDPALMKNQGEELIRAVSLMAGTVHPEMLHNSTDSSQPSDTSSSSPSSGSMVSTDLNLNQTLKSGMQNDDVLKMQNRLDELGYMFVKPTGLYAEATVQIVKDFQYLNNMTVTGVADPQTLKKMFSSDAVKRTNLE
ncbi:MAG: peptidoglycan-binding protein [Oscillospiraceae bacterium]|jgi:ABC-type Fe3+-hydroxamate transport system substrate-binding protein|nr:peptidoglycan-binding protein [Oscillospiraceae bacterium]